MDEEYYKEPRGFLGVSEFVRHMFVLAAGFSFGIGTISVIAYRMASAGVAMLPSVPPDLPDPSVFLWTAGLCIAGLWITFFAALYYDVRRCARLDVIPLTHERITVESRDVVGKEYTMISDSGIVYNALDDEVFSHLTPGAHVGIVSKHYPKDEKKKSLIVRVMKKD